MKPVLTTVLLLMNAATALAHPGWGIVQDSRGNVYFTDTQHVWQVSPDGRVSVAVANVHTHELSIDSDDNLYGEHLWYTAGAAQPWRHRVWRRPPDGSVNDVIPARDGFRSDYSFVRDGAGNMYWADRGQITVIRKRSPDGRISTHARVHFRSVERMTSTPDGTLFLMDAGDLRQVSPTGSVTTVVVGLSGTGRPRSEVARLNYHMGLWTGGDDVVYVAAASEGSVLRVDTTGSVTIVSRSSAPWAPAGGMIDQNGALWILEYDTANAVRARRIDRGGQDRVFVPGSSR